MSRFRINDKVIIKATNEVGVIKGREVVNLADKRVKVEYVVKTGEGFSNWKVYTKKELEKAKTYDKEPHFIEVFLPETGHTILLVAVVKKRIAWKDGFDESGYYSPIARDGKELNIGYSICSPKDKYDVKIGKKIAKHRAKVSPFCHLMSDFSGEFNDETVYALLKVKADYIKDNIGKFVTTE